MTSPCFAPFTVALQHCSSYAPEQVQEAVNFVLQHSGILALNSQEVTEQQGQIPSLKRGMHVLVKPNLLRAQELACTHAHVMKALCIALQEQGIKVIVADSPGFGTAQSVAKSIGLQDALRPLGLSIQEFKGVQSLPLHFEHKDLGSWGIARQALEADAIFSVPRIKAHSQMGMTLSVKNLFGCIVGLRKAMAHAVQGKDLEDFCHSILALYQALPPTVALADGVVAMHKKGPSGGEPFALHMLAASRKALALDTAIYALLHKKPCQIPLWQYAQKAKIPAAFEQNIHHIGVQPPHIYPSTQGVDFELPAHLMDVCFQPHRLLQSLAKRLWNRTF